VDSLGGGLGWLARKAGLALDNLLSAEVVTADGAILRASAEEHPDLYWAIRGGGGNFGVATSLEFRLHEVGPQVQFGFFFWPLEQGAEALRLSRDVVATSPRELIAMPIGLNAPPEPFVPEPLRLLPGYGLLLVGFGSEQEHAAVSQHVRQTLPPLFDLVTPMPYLQLLQMFDAANPWGTLSYDTAVCVEDLTDDVIAVVAEHHPRKNSPLSAAFFYRLDGAYSEVGENDTAFAGGRSPRYAVIIFGAADSADLLPAERSWARAFRDALRPHGIGNDLYVNMSDELADEDRVRASYGPVKYERLARIKAQYDPDNLFHRNANIHPAVDVPPRSGQPDVAGVPTRGVSPEQH
jgi:hypothetical protein